jgi:AhpC/TSA antioxidant enzyme
VAALVSLSYHLLWIQRHSHISCPVAEKTFDELRRAAAKNPEVRFIAVSHSSEDATEKWVIAVGGEWDVEVIVDAERELYARWGLGISSLWHVLNPWSLYSVYKLASGEKIKNRPTESGSRWQTSGSFAVDQDGIVRWSRVAKHADDIPDVQEALATLGVGAE